jgi:hypothetical protein
MSFFLRFAGQPPAPAPPPRAWVSRDRTHPPLAPRTDPTHAAVSPDPISSPRLPSSTRRRDLRDLDAARLAIAWRLRTPPPLPHPPCPLCAPSSPSALARHLPNRAPSASEWSHRQGNAAPSGRCRRRSSFPAVHVLRRHPWMSPPSPPVGRGCHRHLLPPAVDGSSRGRRYRHLLRTPLRSMDASTT